MSCHPERSLLRSHRQTESKDLRLFFGELWTHHASEAKHRLDVLKRRGFKTCPERSGSAWPVCVLKERSLSLPERLSALCSSHLGHEMKAGPNHTTSQGTTSVVPQMAQKQRGL